MTTPEFRCFQLPEGAFREVLKNFDPPELLILSLCSRNANQAVKLNYNKSLGFTLWFSGYTSEPSIGFQCKAPLRTAIVVKEATEFVQIEKFTAEEPEQNGLFTSLIETVVRWAFNSSTEKMDDATKLDDLEKVKIGGQKMEIAKGEFAFEVYSTDPKAGFKTILDYINDLFEDGNGVPLTEEEARYVLAKCDAQEINLSAVFPESFNYTGSFLNYHMISIFYGSWVTIENLISLGESCVDMDIMNSRLTNEDINKFIKHWFKGNMNGFRRLIIKNESVIIQDDILANLKDKMVPVDGIMVYKYELYPSYMDFPPDWNVLQREDGKVLATAITPRTKETVICVWNNIESSQKHPAGFFSYALAPFHNIV
uniref:F-box domain-containing protein n=1 Tax=Caenorhabditis tropicalis TaxID=1561998 RepID=A0A1I7TQ32_9PELO